MAAAHCKPPYWAHPGDEDATRHSELAGRVFYVVGNGFVTGIFSNEFVSSFFSACALTLGCSDPSIMPGGPLVRRLKASLTVDGARPRIGIGQLTSGMPIATSCIEMDVPPFGILSSLLQVHPPLTLPPLHQTRLQPSAHTTGTLFLRPHCSQHRPRRRRLLLRLAARP